MLGLASAFAAPFILAGVTWLIDHAISRLSHSMVLRAKQTIFLVCVGIVLLTLAWLFLDTRFSTFAEELRGYGRRSAVQLFVVVAGAVSWGCWCSSTSCAGVWCAT